MQNKMENYGQKLDKGRPKKWNNNKKRMKTSTSGEKHTGLCGFNKIIIY